MSVWKRTRRRLSLFTPVVVVAVLLAGVQLAGVQLTGTASARPGGLAPLPTDFYWGVSSSGFQSEGYSPDSNWRRHSESGTTHDEIGTSVDFRHRYREDVALARDLGVGVYRVGVEWARVEPRPGVVDETELAYYDDLIKAIVAAGMRPMITLDHWVYPGWVADGGGWTDAATPRRWMAHARRIVDRYAHLDPLWVTVNEPMTYVMEEVQIGALAPHQIPMMFDRLVQVHRAAYDHIHARQPGAMVTSNAAYIPTVQGLIDTQFLDRVRDKLDFLGLDYYYSVAPSQTEAWRALTGETHRAPVAADGLYYAIADMGRRFPGLPLYVVESGMPTRDGQSRPDGYRRGDHLADLVYWVQRARADGFEVIGYNYWSLTDNYEWGDYRPRFGLYTVDVGTDPSLTRRPTDAVPVYRRIIADGGVRSDYRPTRPATFCSLVDAPSSCLRPVR